MRSFSSHFTPFCPCQLNQLTQLSRPGAYVTRRDVEALRKFLDLVNTSLNTARNFTPL